MNQNHSSSKQLILSSFQTVFPGISTLELPDQKFCMSQLISLQLYVRYSIPYINYPQNVQQFYLKLSDFYWENQLNLRVYKQKTQNKVDNLQTDEQVVNHSRQITNLQIFTTQVSCGVKNLSLKLGDLPTTKQQDLTQIQKTKKVVYTIKNFTYQQILNKIQFLKSESYQNNFREVQLKLEEVNSWKTIQIFSDQFDQKKNVLKQNIRIQAAKKIKEDKNQLQSPKIIIGKNQSVQTRQIKHQLKLKAKQSYVQNKQKQQLSMNQFQRQKIQLTYLLNIITFQYFEEFYNQIKVLILLNPNCIPILCEKIIFKVKQEHNFIDIYLLLLKKLSKINKNEFSNSQKKSKFNSFHLKFVDLFQINFVQLLIIQNCSNENLYKKQLKGFFTFMGKLIQSKIISKQIFKVCFWDLVFQYLYNHQFKSQAETCNQCLLEAIFIIAQNMGKKYFQLIQINDNCNGESQKRINNHMFDQIKENIENDDFKCKLVIQILPSSYIQILKLINQRIKSQRRKVQFLIRTLEERVQLQLTSNNQKVLQRESVIFCEITCKQKKNQQLPYSHTSSTLVNQNVQKIIDSIMEDSITMKYQDIIQKKQDLKIQILKQQEQNSFIRCFLLKFADGNKNVVLTRSQLFISLMQKHIFIQKKLKQEIIRKFSDLILISCDFPYLVSQLANIISKAQQLNNDFIQNLEQELYLNDQDVNQFWQEVYKKIQQKKED